MKFARITYLVAGIYGIIVLLPLFFLELRQGEQPLTRPEFLYGFAGIALTWQFAFLVISRDPQRYRPFIPVTWLEKLSFAIPVPILYLNHRVSFEMLCASQMDAILLIFFIIAYLKTGKQSAKAMDEHR